MLRPLFYWGAILGPVLMAASLHSGTEAGPRPPGGRGSRGPATAYSFKVTVPAHAYDLILARPEKSRVTLNVLTYRELEGYVAYGLKSEVYATQTVAQTFQNGVPAELVIGPLAPDTEYHYCFRWRPAGAEAFTNGPDCAFHTTRPPGSRFTFTLTADAHLDERTSADVYLQSLANIRSDRPDFHLDLGNLFMTEKHTDRAEASRQYLAERYYLGQIGDAIPVLLALGTHDGESGPCEDGSSDGLAAWANATRTRYFPNPVSDAFYTGNAERNAKGSLLQNYYAWEWGDALFVVLDPFRYSSHNRDDGGWGWSLGLPQYRWLEQTLSQSRARFKFVFIHNLLCGDQTARGGVEVAGFNEWGGRSSNGSDEFKKYRPGWPMPVHTLLRRHHVAAVFKAHDNFYARQELDGILYLMVPQPSFAGDDRIRDLDAYGYQQGVFRSNSGHVRVTVSPEKVVVSYVKASKEKPVADSCLVTAE